MKRRIIFSVLLVLCCVAFVSCGGTESSYVPFDELPEGYNVEDAEADGCVICVDDDIDAGSELWDDFLKTSLGGERCEIRVVTCYDGDDRLYLTDLSYDGSVYTVKNNDGLSKEYKYLIRYEVYPEGRDKDTGPLIYRYTLIDRDDVTYEEIEASMASSILGDAIDHYTVVSKSLSYWIQY